MEVSALHYTQEDLEQARYLYKVEGTENTVVTIDQHQMGLGSASCGPETLEQYTLPADQAYTYLFRKMCIRDSLTYCGVVDIYRIPKFSAYLVQSQRDADIDLS